MKQMTHKFKRLRSPQKRAGDPRQGMQVQLYPLFNLGLRRGGGVNITPRPLWPWAQIIRAVIETQRAEHQLERGSPSQWFTSTDVRNLSPLSSS